jgi:hypothetical protein
VFRGLYGSIRLTDVRPEPDVVEVVRAALAEIEEQSQLAIETIKAASDVDQALEAVKESYALMKVITESHNQLRTEIAGRVWDKHRLSLAALADRVGVSKSWSEELIKKVRKGREGS